MKDSFNNNLYLHDYTYLQYCKRYVKKNKNKKKKK